MEQDIGKWLLDIAKYVATAFLVSTFLSGLEEKWSMYLAGAITVVLCFFIGLYFIKKK